MTFGGPLLPVYVGSVAVWLLVSVWVHRDCKRGTGPGGPKRPKFWAGSVFLSAVAGPPLLGVLGYFGPFFALYGYIRRGSTTRV